MGLTITSIFVIAAVAGFVELVKRLFAQDWRAAVIIAGSALIGVGAGFVGIDGLTWSTGLITGLAASGLITIAQSTAAKTEIE